MVLMFSLMIQRAKEKGKKRDSSFHTHTEKRHPHPSLTKLMTRCGGSLTNARAAHAHHPRNKRGGYSSHLFPTTGSPSHLRATI